MKKLNRLSSACAVRSMTGLVSILIVTCWTISLYGPISMFIVPVMLIGVVITIYRKSWVALFLLLTLNPLGVTFLNGVVRYCGGAPSLRFVGYPRIESFNLDRSTRCFRNGGGCLVFGNEWVFTSPHNSALRFMSWLFGAPSKSYDGPYPTKEDAFTQTNRAPEIPVWEFVEGDFIVNGQMISIGSELIDKMLDGLLMFPLSYPESSAFNTRVRAVLIQDRCLVIRLSEEFILADGHEPEGNDLMIFFDMKKMRPFAYFIFKGHSRSMRPPVGYLTGSDV